MTDIRAGLREKYNLPWIEARLDELSQAKRTHYHDHTCECGVRKRLAIEIEDSRAALDALKLVIEHGHGKAAQTKDIDPKPIDTGVDPTKLSSEDRKALIQQLKTRITKGQQSDLSQDS